MRDGGAASSRLRLYRAPHIVSTCICHISIWQARMKRLIYKELVAASSRPMVLSILAAGDQYGYEIIKQVRRMSGGDLEWSPGMLYPLLHRLERDGLIEGYWELTDDERPRKYYRLTAAGRRQMSIDRKSWRAVSAALEISWRGGSVAAG